METEEMIDQTTSEFLKELAENDKKVQAEIYQKNREEMSLEFIDFVNKNKCKIKKDVADE